MVMEACLLQNRLTVEPKLCWSKKMQGQHRLLRHRRNDLCIGPCPQIVTGRIVAGQIEKVVIFTGKITPGQFLAGAFGRRQGKFGKLAGRRSDLITALPIARGQLLAIKRRRASFFCLWFFLWQLTVALPPTNDEENPTRVYIRETSDPFIFIFL